MTKIHNFTLIPSEFILGPNKKIYKINYQKRQQLNNSLKIENNKSGKSSFLYTDKHNKQSHAFKKRPKVQETINLAQMHNSKHFMHFSSRVNTTNIDNFDRNNTDAETT